MRIGIGLASFLIFICMSGGCSDGSGKAPPAATTGPHPLSAEPSRPWRFPVNHGSEAKKDLLECQECHGEPGAPGDNPSFAVPIGALERGCESEAGCHFNGPFDNGHRPGTAHPVHDPDDPSHPGMHWYGERIFFVDGSGREQVYLVSHHNAGNLEGTCTLCHGALLDGGVGPACTDCHVTDVLASPSRCVSCHGMSAGNPADLIDEVGRRLELEESPAYKTFTEEVSKGFHLEHDALPCADRDSVEDCRSCHGTDVNVEKHHALVDTIIPGDVEAPVGALGIVYDCLSCHEAVPNPKTGELEFKVDRDCDGCHIDRFPAILPCPE